MGFHHISRRWIKFAGLSMAGIQDVYNLLLEIERHFHNSEQWFGKHAITGFMSRDYDTAWQLTAGAGNAYGTPVQMSSGVEITPGVLADFHRVQITQVSQQDVVYKMQLWYGTDVFANATFLTEFTYVAASNQIAEGPIETMSLQIPVTSKVWARVRCATAGATISLLLGVHVYIF